MADPLIVEVVRSGVRESTHVVDVAVIDEQGRLLAWSGDPEQLAAYRSSAKPLQARVSIEAGWVPPDSRAIAIACASHNGEPEHVSAARAILSECGLDESALRCPADVPLYLPAVMGVRERAPVFHNCSGKHAAMVAACKAAGWPLETYRDADHPLQRAVAALIGSVVGDVRATLVDGCGVPTLVAPLSALARGLLTVEGGPEVEAMRAHPFLVGGTARLDTDLMTAAPGFVIDALLTDAAGKVLEDLSSDKKWKVFIDAGAATCHRCDRCSCKTSCNCACSRCIPYAHVSCCYQVNATF